MKLIVGLGNPGFRYRNTRHNIGFLVVKALSKRLAIPMRKRKYRGLHGSGTVDGEKITLFMPQTYMNLSGEAVREIAAKGKRRLDTMLVICDDIHIRFGSLRLREKGSAGGHNGLASVIESLGTSEFPRLRIGIGRDSAIDDVVTFVLNPFGAEERSRMGDVIDNAVRCVTLWIKEGAERAMTRFNQKKQ